MLAIYSHFTMTKCKREVWDRDHKLKIVANAHPNYNNSVRKWPQFASLHEGTLVYSNNGAIQGGGKRAPPQKPEPYSGRMSVGQSTQQHLEQNRSELQALYSSDCSGADRRKEEKRSSDP